ncbi:MAG TPA: polysaccharide biosynthesis protein [Clostridia bacterium]|nr:polysaccharide biosynthesis protein [Clostridia bacterium]
MKKTIWKGAGLLAFATFFAKIIGALYRIPLTNILGAEGMGVYQLIFPIYSLLLSTSSGALPIAVSMLVSSRLARGEREEALKIVKNAMSALLITGIILTFILVVLSGTLGKLQGSTETRLGYLGIAPAIFFVSGIAVFRGWFQGNGILAPSAFSQISEAIVKLGVGLTLAAILMRYGIAWAVFGAMTGVTLSEIVTFVMLYIMYRQKNPRLNLSLDFKNSRQNYKEITRLTIPMTLGNIILPIVQMIDSFLVVNILSRAVPGPSAVASYGLLTGPVNSLINLPVVIGLSLGVAVIPQITKNKEERDISAIKQKSDTAFKLSLVIGAPFAFTYFALSEGIIKLLYPAFTAAQIAETSMLLRISCFSVIAMSAQQIYTSILQGLGSIYKPVKNMAIGAGIKIILNIALMPVIGIAGVAAASVACFTATAVLNIIQVRSLIGKSANLLKNSGVILLSGVIMGAAIFAIGYFTTGWALPFVTAVVGAALYLAMLLAFRVFSRDELAGLPLGGKLVAITDKIFTRG